MTATAQPKLFAQVFVDRIVWFLTRSDGSLASNGNVPTYAELRGLQLRAGVPQVVLYRAGQGFHLPEALTYGGEWRVSTETEAQQLLPLFTEALENSALNPARLLAGQMTQLFPDSGSEDQGKA